MSSPQPDPGPPPRRTPAADAGTLFPDFEESAPPPSPAAAPADASETLSSPGMAAPRVPLPAPAPAPGGGTLFPDFSESFPPPPGAFPADDTETRTSPGRPAATPHPTGTPTPPVAAPGDPDPHATRDSTDANATNSRVGAPGHFEMPLVGPGLGRRPPPRVEGYEILDVLGRGGMGVVYKARQARLNRLVALKMILAGDHAGEDQRQRFRTEAEAVARLQHPNIVQIYEIGEADGCPFFSLELCPGGSLSARLKASPQPAREAARLVQTLAQAMQAAHDAGVVHRDLKPANVLLAADGTPKITDFGLAKKIDEVGQTASGAIMGSPPYMAPEQAGGKGRLIGPRTDVYALGAMLYELLTGRPPFKAETQMDTILQVLRDEPVPPRRLQSRVPYDLEVICLKCLRKEPARRYAGAIDLAADLGRFLNGEAIRARPVGVVSRAIKWARRRPAAASLIAVTVAAFLAGLVLIVRDNRVLYAEVERAHQEEKKAQQDERKARDDYEHERLGRVRAEALDSLHAGQAALARQDLPGAKLQLVRCRAGIANEPELRDLDAEITLLETAINRAEAEVVAARQARDRFARFTDHYREARFRGTPLSGADRDASLKAARDAARAGLALYGVTPDSPGVPAPDAHLSDAERREVLDGCYELLLVLAEAEATPPRGEEHADARHLAAALRALDRARQLGRETRAYHLRRARYLEESGDRAGAARELGLARACKLDGALDYRLVGEEYYRQGNPKDAIPALNTALRLQEDDFWAQYFLALCYLRPQPVTPEEARANLVQARASLTICLQLRKNFAWGHVLRGFASGELHDFEAAEKDFQEALALNPDADARYGVAVNRGVALVRQARYREAIETLKGAVAQRPKEYAAYASLASAYAEDGRPEQAVAELDRAIALAPQVAGLYRTRAQMHLRQRDRAATLRDLLRAAELEPAVDTYDRQGQVLAEMHQYKDAVAAYRKALRLDAGLAKPTGNAPKIQRRLGVALLELQQYPEAVDAFDRYLERGKPVPEVLRARGLARVKLQQYAQAIDDYSAALALRPDAETYVYRGWARVLCEEPQRALRDFEAAAKLEPENADASSGKGYVEALLGHNAAAVRDAERALGEGPLTPRLVYNVARTFAQVVSRMDADPDRSAPQALEQRALYQDRCLQLIDQALGLVPDAKRPAFWQDEVYPDGALKAVRASAGFGRLVRQYGKPVKPPERRP